MKRHRQPTTISTQHKAAAEQFLRSQGVSDAAIQRLEGLILTHTEFREGKLEGRTTTNAPIPLDNLLPTLASAFPAYAPLLSPGWHPETVATNPWDKVAAQRQGNARPAHL